MALEPGRETEPVAASRPDIERALDGHDSAELLADIAVSLRLIEDHMSRAETASRAGLAALAESRRFRTLLGL